MKQFFKMAFASFVGVMIASFVGSFIWIMILVGIASSDSNVVNIDKNTVLEIDLSGVIFDRYQESPIEALSASYAENRKTSLIDLLTAIDRAKDHPRIMGIYLKANPMMTGYATATELRDKLIEFKASGKFVYAYADSYSQKCYYVASVADTLAVNPIGIVELSGLNSTKTYFKGVLDKLGIEMQVFKVGTFKSAVEPYIRTNRSVEDREQTDSYLQSIWSTVGGSIAESRKIDIVELNKWVDQGLIFGETNELIDKKIIDRVKYESDIEFYESAKERTKENKLKRVNVKTFLASSASTKSSSNRIALVVAEGEIDGSSSEGIVSTKLIKELKDIQEDESIKAVVFRVNSPGGSGFGSEQIWHELMKIKSRVPIVVSMGDYAASGGYYISCMADAIVVQPTTLTGSIGVFGLVPNFAGLFGKIGVSNDAVKTHSLADFGDLSRPVSAMEGQLVQKNVNSFYDLFLTRCSDGRSLAKIKVDSMAQGRVWSGRQALDLKLVDHLGGISKAIEIAAQKAEIDDYEIVEYPAQKEWFVRLVEDMNVKMKQSVFSLFTSEEKQVIHEIRKIKSQDRVRALMGGVPVLD